MSFANWQNLYWYNLVVRKKSFDDSDWSNNPVHYSRWSCPLVDFQQNPCMKNFTLILFSFMFFSQLVFKSYTLAAWPWSRLYTHIIIMGYICWHYLPVKIRLYYWSLIIKVHNYISLLRLNNSILYYLTYYIAERFFLHCWNTGLWIHLRINCTMWSPLQTYNTLLDKLGNWTYLCGSIEILWAPPPSVAQHVVSYFFRRSN